MFGRKKPWCTQKSYPKTRVTRSIGKKSYQKTPYTRTYFSPSYPPPEASLKKIVSGTGNKQAAQPASLSLLASPALCHFPTVTTTSHCTMETTNDTSQGHFLGIIQQKLGEVANQITLVETTLSQNQEAHTAKSLNTCFDAIAKLYGFVEKIQEYVDELDPSNDDQRIVRKAMTDLTEKYIDRLLEANELVDEKKKGLAELKKTLGNTAFKQGEFTRALFLYSEAICIEPLNPTFFTNRALAQLKLDKNEAALADAQQSVLLDVDMLKAYIIVIKCQIKLSRVVDMEKTINSVPIGRSYPFSHLHPHPRSSSNLILSNSCPSSKQTS